MWDVNLQSPGVNSIGAFLLGLIVGATPAIADLDFLNDFDLHTQFQLQATTEPAGKDPVSGARKLLKRSKVAEARNLLARAIVQKHKDSADALVLWGETHVQSEPALARGAAVQALQLDAAHQSALNLLTAAYAYARNATNLRVVERQLTESEVADYSKLLEHQPESAELLYRVASQKLALERLLDPKDRSERLRLMQEAESQLQLSVTQLTKQPEVNHRLVATARHQLGRALKHIGDFYRSDIKLAQPWYRKSIEEFQAAVISDRSRADSIGEIVLVHQSTGDLSAATAIVRKYLESAKDQSRLAKTRIMLGQLLLKSGQLDKSRDAFQQALETDSKQLDAYTGLYQIAAVRGDSDGAAEYLRSAVAAEGNFVNGHLLLGELAVRSGDTEQAIASFERATRVPAKEAVVLGMFPSRSAYRSGLYYRAYSWLAWLYFDAQGDTNKALASATMAEQFQPADPHLLDTKGWIHFKMGDANSARKILQAAVEADGNFPAVHYHLAVVQHSFGDHRAARASLERALSIKSVFGERDAAENLLRRLTTNTQ